MVKKRSTKMGKLMPYVDVREPNDVPKFESMLKVGPVFVLVYADWCGHCQRFKENMWNEVANSKEKTVNTAAVHYNMVDKTSMKNAKIEGYPTLFEVKSKANTNVSVPVPTPQSKEDLEKLIGTAGTNNRGSRMIADSTMAVKDTIGSPDEYVPEPVESLPPNLSQDTFTPEEKVKPGVQAGGYRGGSLLETLLKVSAESAHAVVLAGSALEVARRLKKRKHQTKRRRSVQKKQTRKH